MKGRKGRDDMVGLIDRLKRNRVFAFVLALTLACAMALPTLGFADEEAAGQVAVQAEAGIAGSTDFDEAVGQEKIEETTASGGSDSASIKPVTDDEPVVENLDESIEEENGSEAVEQVLLTGVPDSLIEESDEGVAEKVIPLADGLSDEKKILSLTVNGIAPTNPIGSPMDPISVRVPWGTDMTTLVHEVEVSPGATYTTYGTPDYLVYTITAEDGSENTYTVFVGYDEIPTTDFGRWENMAGGTVSATVDLGGVDCEFDGVWKSYADGWYQAVELREGVDYTISGNTTVTLTESYLKQLDYVEYSYTVQYSVGNKTGSATPTLTVVDTDTTPKSITKFSINGVEGNITTIEGGSYIYVHLPYGTDLSSLVPTITHTGVSVIPESGVVQDFSKGTIYYRVKSENGTYREYTVGVTWDAIPATGFGTWEGSGTSSATVEADKNDFYDLGFHLLVSTVIDGQGFVPPVKDVDYAVSESDGKSLITFSEDYLNTLENGTYAVHLDYLNEEFGKHGYVYLTLEIANPDKAKEIISVSVGDSSTDYISWEYSPAGVRQVVAVYVAGLTDKSSIEPEIEYEGASISPEGPQDFSDPEDPSVVYTVTAKDGSSKEHHVYVYRAPLLTDVVFERTGLTKATVSFTSDCAGDIRITIPRSLGEGYYPFITEPTTCVAGKNTIEFEFSPDIYDPEAENYQAYPEFENLSASIPALVWLYSDVEPAVAGAEWTREEAAIPAWKEPEAPVLSTTKDITAFTVGGKAATITGTDITVELPFGTDVTALATEITHTGKTILPAGGTTDFTNPVKYTVTAEDGTTKIYTVTVTVTPGATSKEITAVTVGDAEGVIDGADITVLLPVGTDVTAVTPTIVHTGVSVTPTTAQDFSQGPVQYTVTAQDGSTKIYTVNVQAILLTATDGGIYTGTETISSTVDAPADGFIELDFVVGEELVKLTEGSDFTVTEGADGTSVITLTDGFLATLGNGSYEFAAIYDQGVALFTVVVELPVEEPVTGDDPATPTTPGDTTSVPKTGDGAIVMLLVAGLLVLGGTSLVVASGRARAGRHLR